MPIMSDGKNYPGKPTKARRRKEYVPPKMICMHCLEELTADQPGGLNPRHRVSGLPYGWCRESLVDCARVSLYVHHPDVPPNPGF